MPVTALITHRIRCRADGAPEVTLADHEQPLDDATAALTDACKQGFLGRLTREHGSFADDGEPAPLPRELAAHGGEKPALAALSRALMGHWQALLAAEPRDLDAHVICFTEHADQHAVLYLLAAGDKPAFGVGDDLRVATVRHLDLGPSLFGIKVDLHEWRTAKHYAYLSLVPPRGDRALADGFAALTGFTAGLDKADTTDAFLTGVEAFARQVDADRVDDYRSQVVDYCAAQEQRDAPVDLGELARAVDGIDGERFSRFMADYAPAGDDALMLDRRCLRRYVKFAGREKDLAISFSSSQLNSRVHYDPERDTLSIDGIPRALREQLLRHLGQ